MIPREIRPGVVVLVSEEEAWAELLTGARPRVEESRTRIVVKPGDDALCLVEDRGVTDEPPPDPTLSLL
ncbi:MAG: hypothetical protein FJ087_20395 [Deltaproteobacteria bacterium]|nr:hypothetical protein [Deltaproteobacteria bacterium]